MFRPVHCPVIRSASLQSLSCPPRPPIPVVSPVICLDHSPAPSYVLVFVHNHDPVDTALSYDRYPACSSLSCAAFLVRDHSSCPSSVHPLVSICLTCYQETSLHCYHFIKSNVRCPRIAYHHCLSLRMVARPHLCPPAHGIAPAKSAPWP
jgi:hypothetical protein